MLQKCKLALNHKNNVYVICIVIYNVYSNSPYWGWTGFFYKGPIVLSLVELTQERETVNVFSYTNLSNNLKCTILW